MGNLKTGVHLSIVLRIREDLLDNNNNNNKPFIDLKCTYYTRMAAQCKYSYDFESEIFTTEIDIAQITNITYEIQLLS